jgi:predicted TIM-barrel fold metal-dependent hydrolase
VIVDAHLHVFLPDSPRYPRTVDALAPAGRTAPVEDLVATMDGAGVDRAVLVPLGPEDAYVAECRAADPGRFAMIGVADDAVTGRVPGTDPVRALRDRTDRTGLSGLRMNHLGDPAHPVTESPAWPALAHMAEHGLIVWAYLTPDQLPLLDQALTALPRLRVALNHLGFCPTGWDWVVDAHRRPHIPTELPPPTLPDVLALARHPGVRVHFSGQYAFSGAGYPYPDLDPLARALYDAFGADRLMWASDFPWIRDEPGYARLLDLPARQMPWLTAAERDAVLGGTALHLFADAWGTP